MFKLDNDFLQSLGLGGLPVDEKNRLLQMIYERLEMNVGMRLAEKMTDQQLDEFESFIDQNDEAGALKWLETNFPNYKDVVSEELEKLKVEVQTAAPQILAAQTGGGQQPPIMSDPMMPGVPQPQQQYGPAPQPLQMDQPFGPPQQPGFTPQPPAQPAPVYQPDQQPNAQPQYSPAGGPSYQQPAQPAYQPQPMQPQPQPMPSYQPPTPQPSPGFGSDPIQPQQPQQFTPPPPGFNPGE